MFISSAMCLGARVFLLLVPLVAALDPVAAHAAESGDFAGLVDIGSGRKVTAHPFPANDQQAAGSERIVRAARMASRGLWALRRPVATMEQRSA